MGWVRNHTKDWTDTWSTGFMPRGDIVPSFGLLAWYDFSNSAYLTLSATAITQALDRSGNGNHTAVQGTATARPTYATGSLNGLPVATFDGGDTLVLPSALYAIPGAANTVFAVAKRNTESGATAVIIQYSDTPDVSRNSLSFNSTAGEVLFRNDAGAGSAITNAGNTNTNYQILMGSFNGTTGLAVSVNNNTATTSTTGAVDSTIDRAYIGSRTGSSLFLTGAIGEIIVYNRLLSASESAQVYRYLSNKWGITIS